MIGWLIRLIILFLVLRALWRLLAGIVEGAMGPAERRRTVGPTAVPLVQDPVCGTYVPRARALTSGEGGSMHYFCSERCLGEFEKARRAR